MTTFRLGYSRPPRRLPAITGLISALILVGSIACRQGNAASMTSDERQVLADSLMTLVKSAYDFSQPDAPARLLSLYPDSGRVISAAAGRISTTHRALEHSINSFWMRVGQNMQQPRFVLGSQYVDVLTRDAAVVTIAYSIPHLTPLGREHVVTGAWTMLWRRVNGRWQIVQEHLSDTPESVSGQSSNDSTAGLEHQDHR